MKEHLAAHIDTHGWLSAVVIARQMHLSLVFFHFQATQLVVFTGSLYLKIRLFK